MMKELHTKRGKELGVDPVHAEITDQIIRENTSGVIQPLNETPKQTRLADSGKYKGEIPYAIMESAEKEYVGIAFMRMRGKMLSVETYIYKTPKGAYTELSKKLDVLIRERKKINEMFFRREIGLN